MALFSSNKNNVNELNEIVNEYNTVHSEYDLIMERIDKLTEQLKELDLLRHESEVKLLINREREKKFMDNLQETDFEAYLDLRKNINEYLNKKMEENAVSNNI